MPPQLDEFYMLDDASQKIDFHKIHVNIKHIKCVAIAIGTAISDSNLAIEWIGYNLELKNSIARLVACGKNVAIQQKVYVYIKISETFCWILQNFLWIFRKIRKKNRFLKRKRNPFSLILSESNSYKTGLMKFYTYFQLYKINT